MARREPVEIVNSTLAKNRTETWYDALHPSDKIYVLTVIEELKKAGAPVRPVAVELVKELNLKVSAQTVSKFISEYASEQL